LFERVSLPSVLGEIIAGAVLGPYAMGLIPSTDSIHSIVGLGAIFVLFSARLETNPGELIRTPPLLRVVFRREIRRHVESVAEGVQL